MTLLRRWWHGYVSAALLGSDADVVATLARRYS